MLILSFKNKPTSHNYFECSFPNYNFDWEHIHLLPQIITIEQLPHNFQYNILRNILFLNKKLYTFGKIDSPLCLIFHSNDETVIHLFCDCVLVSRLWS